MSASPAADIANQLGLTQRVPEPAQCGRRGRCSSSKRTPGPAAYCGVLPVEFLSDAEAAAYGRDDGGPTREELDRVDDADRELIEKRRGEHNRLGFALQLTTARWLGVFRPDPTAVPKTGLRYVADQLELEDPAVIRRYLERRRTRFEHAEEIKRSTDCVISRRSATSWSSGRPPPAYMTGDGPRAIFTDGIGWLREHDVLLPGVTTLARLIAQARADGDERAVGHARGAPDFASGAGVGGAAGDPGGLAVL
jgi:hypothetical protein